MSTAERILKTAIDLFVEHGIKPVTMDTIASETGISKRTLYENFKDKAALVYASLLKAAVKDREDKLALINTSDNMIEAIFKLKRDNYEKMTKLNRRFFSDIKRYYADIESSLGNEPELINGELTFTLLRRGVNEGIIRKEVDIEMVNEFMFYMFKFFYKFSQEECSDLQIKIDKSVFLPYVRGLCTQKGLKLLDENLERYPLLK